MKIGTVPYINSLPLHYFLPQKSVVQMYPSQLPLALLSGELDCALLPLYAIIKNNLKMHPEMGIIGCDGAVKSVGFFTRSYIKDLSEIQSIYMDKESLSSVYLAKIILKKFYNVSLYDLEFFHYDNKEMADAQLLIGDKALFAAQNRSPDQFWDLGKIWKQHTGAGFMFAAWASKKTLTPAEASILKDAKNEGLKNREKIVQTFETDQQDQIRDYLQNRIIYEETPAITEGLKQYKKYLKEYHYSEPLELKVA